MNIATTLLLTYYIVRYKLIIYPIILLCFSEKNYFMLFFLSLFELVTTVIELVAIAISAITG